MILIRTSDRQRLSADNCPDDCPASSAGRFVIRADGTARFDRHYHDFGEFWFIAAGAGTIKVGPTRHPVIAGDIIFTPAGQEHDILTVASELWIFWLSARLTGGGSGAHLHTRPEFAHKHPVAVTKADADA